MIQTALFPVAGVGARWLPITKSIPKAMFPLLNEPIIHTTLNEAADAGIKRAVLITNSNCGVIQNYFGSVDCDYASPVKLLDNLTSSIAIEYVQSQPIGLGAAIFDARDTVGDEPFGVFLPNDIIMPMQSCFNRMTEVFSVLQAPLLAVTRMPMQRISTYGNVGAVPVSGSIARDLNKSNCSSKRVYEIHELIQRPDPAKGENLSDLAIVGRYILTPALFPIIESLSPGYSGEVQLTDALLDYVRLGHKLYAYEFEGEYYDTRSENGYIAANIAAGMNRSDLREDLLDILRRFSTNTRPDSE